MLILFPKAFVWQKQSSLEEKASYVYYRLVRNFTELRTKRPCYVPTGRKVTYQPILRYVPNTEIINFIQLIVRVGTPYIYQTNRWCVYYSKLVCFWCHPITIRRLFTYYTENKKKPNLAMLRTKRWHLSQKHDIPISKYWAAPQYWWINI